MVEHWDRKGFETYYNLGKDIDSPIWKEENGKKLNKKKSSN